VPGGGSEGHSWPIPPVASMKPPMKSQQIQNPHLDHHKPHPPEQGTCSNWATTVLILLQSQSVCLQPFFLYVSSTQNIFYLGPEITCLNTPYVIALHAPITIKDAVNMLDLRVTQSWLYGALPSGIWCWTIHYKFPDIPVKHLWTSKKN
jgi:hypothetical protein